MAKRGMDGSENSQKLFVTYPARSMSEIRDGEDF